MGGEIGRHGPVITLGGCDPKARWHRPAKLFRLCLKPRSLEETGLWLLAADWLTFAHENHSRFPPNSSCTQRKLQRDPGRVWWGGWGGGCGKQEGWVFTAAENLSCVTEMQTDGVLLDKYRLKQISVTIKGGEMLIKIGLAGHYPGGLAVS